MPVPRKKNKTPPIMSHEFVIQNHADLLACVAIVIVAGLMTEKTSKLSKVFIHLQYGVEKNETDSDGDMNLIVNDYERGFLDIFTAGFAALMLVVFHAVLQEYVIDKLARKLHLSKSKTSKFNESGHLVAWCLVSAAWGLSLMYEVGFHRDITLFWKDYPHNVLNWGSKLFFISQIGYWLHLYPELYFLKVRKEDIPSRVQDYSLHLGFIVGAYILNFWRVALLLLSLHYVALGLFHVSRLFYYAEKRKESDMGFSIWKVFFCIARGGTIILSAMTFIVGLGSAENKGFDISTGNFNSFLIRTSSFASLLVLQVWLLLAYFRLTKRRSKEVRRARQMSAGDSDADSIEVKPKRTPRARKNKSEKTDAANISARKNKSEKTDAANISARKNKSEKTDAANISARKNKSEKTDAANISARKNKSEKTDAANISPRKNKSEKTDAANISARKNKSEKTDAANGVATRSRNKAKKKQ